MAYSRRVYTCNAFSGMAFCRAVIIYFYGALVLVASCPTLAERFEARPVYDPVSLFCDAAVRHPLRISGFLRPRGLPGLLVLVTPVRLYSAWRSAVCSRFDVDLRHSGVPGRRSDRSHAAALPGETS